MTREEAYSQCLTTLSKTNFTLVELPTGYGKSYISIRMTNHLIETTYKDKSEVSILLLVAKLFIRKLGKMNWLSGEASRVMLILLLNVMSHCIHIKVIILTSSLWMNAITSTVTSDMTSFIPSQLEM